VSRGQPVEAEKLARQAVAIVRKTLPDGHWKIAEAEIVLGSTYTALGRYAEAESLLLAGLPTLRQETGKSSRQTRRALTMAVNLYDTWGKPAEAARYRDLLQPGGD
jgi:hypothetical protein